MNLKAFKHALRRAEARCDSGFAEALIGAIQQGMGIGMLPLYAAVHGLCNGTLMRVLPNYTLQRMNIYVLYPSRHFVDAKTRTWLHLLRAHVPELIARDAAMLARYSGETATIGASDAAPIAPALAASLYCAQQPCDAINAS